ncbi:hypothetical protein [Nocardia sp. CY41]|uniref:hypothetical protein n=1 Tax=Nocardia sp. CY41 TaxID=2608686 RepID=UPI00135C90CD|nr:hypothetical protein [Nocardia sp. CY41]
MIGYLESSIDGTVYIVGDDGYSYTAEEYADLLEDRAIDHAHELLDGFADAAE